MNECFEGEIVDWKCQEGNGIQIWVQFKDNCYFNDQRKCFYNDGRDQRYFYFIDDFCV